MKTKILTIMMLCGVCYGYAQNTPPYAASTQTWTFGEQTWSDAIHCPECDLTCAFYRYDYDPVCCSYSYTEKGKWYYYNWAYVITNKDTMCPFPWRVPSQSDFETLVSNTTYSTLIYYWGYGGRLSDYEFGKVSDSGSYWSGTVSNNVTANYLKYDSETLHISYSNRQNGFQVRCVK